MISRLRGTLLSHDGTTVEIAVASGVVYEVGVPLSVAERLPRAGTEIELRTVQVVREDLIALYGFLEGGERALFQTLMQASGVGAKLALAMLSSYSAARLAQALADRDVGALVQIPGVGKKSAERIALELSDRVEALGLGGDGMGTAPNQATEAVQALVALGMPYTDAERAVRATLQEGESDETEEIVRRALAKR